jgi:hypothetical protein
LTTSVGTSTVTNAGPALNNRSDDVEIDE